jgi:AcrR family transcriptional regulator
MSSREATVDGTRPIERSKTVRETPAARRRATRPNKRNIQKMRTRRLILQVGREMFASSGLTLPTVEDVTKAASISRQAFYLHFESRDALLLKLFDREVRWHMRSYRSLGAPAAMNKKALHAWVLSIIVGFEGQKKYITIMKRALALDQSLLARIFEERRRFILHMGRKVPQFRLLQADGSVDEERVAELQMMLLEIENLSEYSAFGAWNDTRDFAIDRIVQRFLSFAEV